MFVWILLRMKMFTGQNCVFYTINVIYAERNQTSALLRVPSFTIDANTHRFKTQTIAFCDMLMKYQRTAADVHGFNTILHHVKTFCVPKQVYRFNYWGMKKSNLRSSCLTPLVCLKDCSSSPSQTLIMKRKGPNKQKRSTHPLHSLLKSWNLLQHKSCDLFPYALYFLLRHFISLWTHFLNELS